MMKMHLDQTLKEAPDHLTGKFAADVRDYDAVHRHILDDGRHAQRGHHAASSRSASAELHRKGAGPPPPTAGPRGSGLDEAAADRVAGQLDAVAHAELLEDVGCGGARRSSC